jgi:hypothetical protein
MHGTTAMKATLAQDADAPDAILTKYAAEIRLLGRRARNDIIRIGELLHDAHHRDIPHGRWKRWLEAEFGWSDQTARRFINLYQFAERARTEPKFKFNKLLQLDVPFSALYLIAAQNTSDETRAELVERVEAGERLTYAKVQDAVTHRAKKARAPRDRAIKKLKDGVAAVSHACAGLADLPIPPLAADEIDDVLGNLDEAISNINRFRLAIADHAAFEGEQQQPAATPSIH